MSPRFERRPEKRTGAAPAGLAVLPASAVPSLNGAAMEPVKAVRAVREEKAVRAVKGQEIGIPGERPVHDPPPGCIPLPAPPRWASRPPQ